jgi:hypothetical protein
MAVDQDLKDALHKLETGLRKEVGDLALKVERTHGSTEILKSRFDSEVGHLRREVGEALNKLDRNAGLAGRIDTAESRIESAQQKIDTAVEKLDKQAKISERVIRLEEKDKARVSGDKKRDAGLLTLSGIAGTGVMKFVYDLFKGSS